MRGAGAGAGGAGSFPVARKLAPSTAAVVLNIQHDLQAPCILTPVTAPFSRQSKLAGRHATSSSDAGTAAGMLPARAAGRHRRHGRP